MKTAYDHSLKEESPNKNHKKIPGNPSTATSSELKLNDRSINKTTQSCPKRRTIQYY